MLTCEEHNGTGFRTSDCIDSRLSRKRFMGQCHRDAVFLELLHRIWDVHPRLDVLDSLVEVCLLLTLSGAECGPCHLLRPASE